MIYLCSLVVAAIAAISDVKSRIITNTFILRSYVIGFALRIFLTMKYMNKGIFLDGIIGLILPYLILVLLYAFTVIGAADIKLLSALGLIIGAKRVCIVILGSFIFGGLIGIVEMVIFKKTGKYKMPYALPILLALVFTIVEEFIYEGHFSCM